MTQQTSAQRMRAHREHLRQFALFMAREFDGIKRGEWRCPMIGAESATEIVEAIAAVLSPGVVEERRQDDEKKKELLGANAAADATGQPSQS